MYSHMQGRLGVYESQGIIKECHLRVMLCFNYGNPPIGKKPAGPPINQHGVILIPARISNHTPNSATIEVWEWISNFTPHFIICVITYQCQD